MRTVIKSDPIHRSTAGEKTVAQKICISVGTALIVLGLIGVSVPGFLDMHLSIIHNVIYIGSGAVAVWSGFSSLKRSLNFCIGFGTAYGFLGIAGFVLGEPGYPRVGNLEADQNLFRIIPSVLELGSMDHIVHMLISAFLIYTAYSFRYIKNK